MNNAPGTYIIILNLDKDSKLNIGRLGQYQLSRGYYAYVGSALGPGGLTSRIRHHLRSTTAPHWHIDYLQPIVEPLVVWYTASKLRLEHTWASVLQSSHRATVPVPGFGSSDCRCPSHLFYFRMKPTLRWFKRAAGKRYPTQTVIYGESIKRITANIGA